MTIICPGWGDFRPVHKKCCHDTWNLHIHSIHHSGRVIVMLESNSYSDCIMLQRVLDNMPETGPMPKPKLNITRHVRHIYLSPNILYGTASIEFVLINVRY